MANEDSGWGYDRIAGALANLGHVVSDHTVGNVLRAHGIAPAPKRRQTVVADLLRDHDIRAPQRMRPEALKVEALQNGSARLRLGTQTQRSVKPFQALCQRN